MAEIEKDRGPSRLPEGSGMDVPPMPGTSADAPEVQGIHTPDVGDGGRDIDEGERPLASRPRTARDPDVDPPPRSVLG